MNRLRELAGIVAELTALAIVFPIAFLLEIDNQVRQKAVADRDQQYIDMGIREVEFMLRDAVSDR